MKRASAILLLCAFAALASGALEYLHNAQHQAHHDHAAAHGLDAPPPAHHHDDSNCDLHRRLHMPAVAAQWVPLLIFLGLFVAFLTLLSPRLAPQRALVSVACRGPPAV
jgi:hypothetical protein